MKAGMKNSDSALVGIFPPSLCLTEFRVSGDDFMNHFAVDIRQSHVAPAESEGRAGVIDTKEV
jgi:hypothetical protein